MNHRQRERGVTALFVVIFASILFSIITVSFIGLMLRDQSRSTDDEQSQGALDAAMVGVEDAKRAVALCLNGNTTACDAVNSGKCTTTVDATVASATGNEVLVRSDTTGTGTQLNLAYTCVTVAMQTDDYRDSGEIARPLTIPLRATADIAKIKIEWQKTTDNLTGTSCATSTAPTLLCAQSSWLGAPAMMRVRAVTPPPTGFTLPSLDEKDTDNTVFLYPGKVSSVVDLSAQARYPLGSTTDTPWTPNRPQLAACNMAAITAYYCSITLPLPRTVSAGSRTSYLILQSMYRNADVRVTLYDTNNKVVQFDKVQPIVDSNGRANDLFRRVFARLSLSMPTTFPDAAVSTGMSFCKDFYVTGTSASSSSSPACTP